MQTMAWTDERLEERFDGIDRRFDEVDRRFDEVDSKFQAVDQPGSTCRNRHRRGRAESGPVRIGGLYAEIGKLHIGDQPWIGGDRRRALIGVIAAILAKGG